MDSILPNEPPYVPKTKQKTTIVFGEPLYFDDLLRDLKQQNKSPVGQLFVVKFKQFEIKFKFCV